MLSLSKILALAAILGAVWFGFKLIGRLDDARRRKAATVRAGDTPETRSAGVDGVIDMVRDETGAYVAREKRDDRA